MMNGNFLQSQRWKSHTKNPCLDEKGSLSSTAVEPLLNSKEKPEAFGISNIITSADA